MHLADRITLPAGLRARAYRGREDHPAMAEVASAYWRSQGEGGTITVAELDKSYANLTDCDPDLDIALVEHADSGRLVAYTRPRHLRLADGSIDLLLFAGIDPEYLQPDVFHTMADAQEDHLLTWLDGDRVAGEGTVRYRARAKHPGPDETATGEAAYLEAQGYQATHWEASLRRPHLDDIPDHPLPDGIEVRTVTPDQIRPIVAAHLEAFRGEWDFSEPVERDFDWLIDFPQRDETLWQVAWDGDTVVGQVKPFIDHDENTERGIRRAYTEFISTHADYRNRGIAKALLARAIQAVRDRGMDEAVLGVDTDNPGGAFHLYTSLGFELQSYIAHYTKPVPAADRSVTTR